MKGFIEVTLTSYHQLKFGGEPSSDVGKKITINPLCIAIVYPLEVTRIDGKIFSVTQISFLSDMKKSIEVSEKYDEVLKLISEATSGLCKTGKSHTP